MMDLTSPANTTGLELAKDAVSSIPHSPCRHILQWTFA
jgi:hypothetical protein